MKIDGGYEVVKGPNDLDFCLVYHYTGKTRQGENRDAQKVLGYFPSIDQVINKILKTETLAYIDTSNLEKLKEKLDQVQKNIMEAINEKK
jgi:hypothetical protein